MSTKRRIDHLGIEMPPRSNNHHYFGEPKDQADKNVTESRSRGNAQREKRNKHPNRNQKERRSQSPFKKSSQKQQERSVRPRELSPRRSSSRPPNDVPDYGKIEQCGPGLDKAPKRQPSTPKQTRDPTDRYFPKSMREEERRGPPQYNDWKTPSSGSSNANREGRPTQQFDGPTPGRRVNNNVYPRPPSNAADGWNRDRHPQQPATRQYGVVRAESRDRAYQPFDRTPVPRRYPDERARGSGSFSGPPPQMGGGNIRRFEYPRTDRGPAPGGFVDDRRRGMERERYPRDQPNRREYYPEQQSANRQPNARRFPIERRSPATRGPPANRREGFSDRKPRDRMPMAGGPDYRPGREMSRQYPDQRFSNSQSARDLSTPHRGQSEREYRSDRERQQYTPASDYKRQQRDIRPLHHRREQQDHHRQHNQYKEHHMSSSEEDHKHRQHSSSSSRMHHNNHHHSHSEAPAHSSSSVSRHQHHHHHDREERHERQDGERKSRHESRSRHEERGNRNYGESTEERYQSEHRYRSRSPSHHRSSKPAVAPRSPSPAPSQSSDSSLLSTPVHPRSPSLESVEFDSE